MSNVELVKVEFPFAEDEYAGHLHVDSNSSESLDEAVQIHQLLREKGLFITSCFVEGSTPPELLLTPWAAQKAGVTSLIGTEAILGVFQSG